mgnify:CR=1 FL=1
MSRNMVINKLTKEADELAIQWNKTKDTGIRDQWYKKLKEIAVHIPKEKVDKEYNNPI